LAFAHNTNTTHTAITDQALALIKKDDEQSQAYSELYLEDSEYHETKSPKQYKLRYWGADPVFTQNDSENDDKADFKAFTKQRLNVMDGVVMEDHPLNRVFSHFYHAYSGIPMTTGSYWAATALAVSRRILLPFSDDELLGLFGKNEPSKRTGIRFFDQAVEVFGYLDEEQDPEGFRDMHQAKELGFWLYGHSLHHVEDMNSIAHVTNDMHLTEGAQVHGERDDFEAHYLPSKLWSNHAEIRQLFNVAEGSGPKTPTPINSFDQIWPVPVPNPTDLIVGENGQLETTSMARTVFNFAHFQGKLEYPVSMLWRLLTSKKCGEGEIAEMFNYGLPPGQCRLRIEWKNPFLSSWQIDGIGGYYYGTFNAHSGSAWWEASHFGGPAGYFYIEQTMNGVELGETYTDSNLVVPPGIRSDFTKKYDKVSNPVRANVSGPGDHGALTRYYATTLVPLGVRYAAGYSKFWYDIVNTPPYLKRVQVYQGNESRYAASWKDEYTSRDVILKHEKRFNVDEILKMSYVKSRYLTPDPKHPVIGFINPKEGFQIRLEFNEPIRDPNNDNSGFSIGFVNSITLQKDTHYTVAACTDYEPAQKNSSQWMQGRCWEVKVNAGSLPQDLNGRVKLKVQAKDL